MRKLLRNNFFAGLSGVFVCVGPVSAAQAPVVDITSGGARVRGGPSMEERVTKLESVLENRTLEEFAARIDAMQQDLQRLQGDAETVNHNIEDLKRKQRELYLDLDHRLRTLETAQHSSNGSGGDIVPNAITASLDERANYDAAFGTMRDGKYEQAIIELQSFLKKYPNSEHAANAQYWLGEAFYLQHRYDTALIAFEQVVTRYPASPKISDALLKLGLAQYELGVWDKSAQALKEVVTKFPNTSQAQLATQRLEQIRLEGH
ncbi:MAG: tol-pal system protein YbgF [Gammaproteobacteria bacterium]|nr:tol-pal system protein YbgF [Gammaproteobacteria bacterium]